MTTTTTTFTTISEEKKLRKARVKSVTVSMSGERIKSPYRSRRKLLVLSNKNKIQTIRMLLEAMEAIAKAEAGRTWWLPPLLEIVDNKERLLRIVIAEKGENKYTLIKFEIHSKKKHEYAATVLIARFYEKDPKTRGP